ncbi:MAG: hypothetical protein K2U26_12640 [Cyclobacteriaceae bacterium]|nr:hypothetical protein [Cyclobacteriaceae bacterium]
MKKYILILLLAFTAATAQAAPPLRVTEADTVVDKNTLKKILHWVSVFTMYSSVDLTDKVDLQEYAQAADIAQALVFNPELRQRLGQFRQNTFVNVYPQGMLAGEEWILKKLNEVSLAQYSVMNPPFITIEVWFRPDASAQSYTVSLLFKTNEEKLRTPVTNVNSTLNASLLGKTYTQPRQAKADVNAALFAGLTALETAIGNTFAPNIAVRFNDELYINNQTIETWQRTAEAITIQAVDRNNYLLSGPLTWTGVVGTGNTVRVPVGTVGMERITLKSGTFEIGILVKVKEFNLDLSSLLKRLIVEALSKKKKQASEDLATLRKDSVANAAAIRELLASVERDNFPMESTGATLTPMFVEPITLSDTSAFRDGSLARVATLKEIKKRKRIRTNIRRNLNIEAVADLIVKDQNRINTLLDNLLKNSGQLIASLITGKDSKGQEDVARDIIVDYINQNLEQLTGAPPVEDEKPLIAEATSSNEQFVATKFVYVNKQLPLSSSTTFIKALEDSARKKNTYVFINYSLDVSTQAYLQRSNAARPKGLPPNTKFVTISVVNIPGSIQNMMFGSSNRRVSGGQNQEKNVWDYLEISGQGDNILNVTWVPKNQIPCTKCLFLSPAGKPILVNDPEEVAILRSSSAGFTNDIFPTYPIYGYRLKDGITFFSDYRSSTFLGYYKTSEKNAGYATFPGAIDSFDKLPVDIILAQTTGDSFKKESVTNKDWFTHRGDKNLYNAEGEFLREVCFTCKSRFVPLSSTELSVKIQATKSLRDAEYTKDVKRFQEKLKLLLNAQSTIALDDNIVDLESKQLIDERLQSYNKINNNSKKIFIISGRVNYFLDLSEWDTFSAEVSNTTPGFNSQNYTLVVMPFVVSETPGVSTTGALGVKPVADVFVGYSGLNKGDSRQVPDVLEFFERFYSQIPKPYIIHSYTLGIRGNLDYQRISSTKEVIGYGKIYDIRFFVDNRIEIADKYWGLASSLSQTNTQYSLYSPQMVSRTKTEYEKFANDFFELLKVDRKQADYAQIELPIPVFEKYIESYHDEIVNNFILRTYRGMSSYARMVNAAIENSALKEPVDVILNLIDLGGFLTSFIGLDVLFDISGASYSLYRGYTFETAIYSASSIVPFATGAGVRQTTKITKESINNLSVYSVKSIDEQLSLAFKSSDTKIRTLLNSGDNRSIINSNPNFLAKVSLLTDNAKALLLDDLLSKPEMVDLLAKDINAIDAWEMIVRKIPNNSGTTQFARDISTLKKISEYLTPSNSNKLEAIGGRDGLESFIGFHKDVPCVNCTGGVAVFAGRTLDEMIENYVEVGYNFKNNKPLWDKLKQGTESSNPHMREGTQHTLEAFRKNPERYSPEKIENIDMKFEELPEGIDLCTNCRYDVKFKANAGNDVPRLAEFKSYSKDTWARISGSEKFLKQFMAYLASGEVVRIEDLVYVINIKKASVEDVKRSFVEIFTKNKLEIFNSMNSSLKNSLFIDEVVDLDQSKINQIIDSFVKLE